MCLCVYIVCVSVHVYVCGVPNIKFISLPYMPNEPKSAKCTNGICICVCMCVCMCLCVSVFACVSGMPNIKLVSLAFYVK